MANKVPAIRFIGFTDAWEQLKLGEIVTIKSGMSPSAFELGVELYVKVDDLNYSFREQNDTQMKVTENTRCSKVKKGSIIFPKRGAAIMTNKVRIMGTSGYMDTNMMALEPEEISSEFLCLFINKTGLYKIADTSTIPQINNKHIVPYEIIMPKIEEQLKIGAYFNNLDNLITLHQCKLLKLKNVKKAMLEKMFPKDGSNVPEIRFAGFTDAWEQRKLSEIADIIGGGTPSTNNPEYWDGNIDWYAPAEMEGQRYAIGSVKKITELGLQKSSATILPAGRTVLFTSRAGIGKMALLQRSAATNQGFQSIVLKDGYNPYFIYSMGSKIKELAEGVASGSTFLEISGKMLGNLTISVPTTAEQDKVASYYQKLDDLITLHQRKLDKMQNVKKACLEKMFV